MSVHTPESHRIEAAPDPASTTRPPQTGAAAAVPVHDTAAPGLAPVAGTSATKAVASERRADVGASDHFGQRFLAFGNCS